MLSKLNIGISALICVYCCCITICYYTLKCDYDLLKADNLVLKLENKDLKTEIDKQNIAIENMAKDKAKLQEDVNDIRSGIDETPVEIEVMEPSQNAEGANNNACSTNTQTEEAFRWLLKKSTNTAVRF